MIRSWQVAIGFPVIFAGLGSNAAVFAQGNVFNPYGNSGYADYREFATPMYSPDPSLPGQARIQGGLYGRNQANQFESYTNSIDGLGATQSSGRNGASGYLNDARAEGAMSRTYRPNDTAADRLFRERRSQRDAAYSKAMEEKDPRKRAYLMQQIDRDSLDRPLSAVTRKLAAQAAADRATQAAENRPATKAGARRAAPGAATPPASGTSAAARGPAPAARRNGAAATTRAPQVAPAAEPAAIAPITPPQ